MEKYHKQEVSPVEEENERDETFEADNPQIDSERTKDNHHMNFSGLTYTEFINKRLNELGLRPRKDAVVMNSFVVGSDKTFFDGLPKMLQYSFFSDCAKFFEERYGEENIMSAVVHLDETTPHMHLNLIPITPDGRLCSKDLFDKPKLQQLQTDFYEMPNLCRNILNGANSVSVFFSAVEDLCKPSVMLQVPRLQQIEAEVEEERVKHERKNKNYKF